MSFALLAKGQKITTATTLQTEKLLLSLNKKLDDAVVKKDAEFLKKHIADDFVFRHGTGEVDTKQSWLKYVLDTKTEFKQRINDSVKVELHSRFAIVSGLIRVLVHDAEGDGKYGVEYIRVYYKKHNRWQIASHRTIRMW